MWFELSGVAVVLIIAAYLWARARRIEREKVARMEETILTLLQHSNGTAKALTKFSGCGVTMAEVLEGKSVERDARYHRAADDMRMPPWTC